MSIDGTRASLSITSSMLNAQVRQSGASSMSFAMRRGAFGCHGPKGVALFLRRGDREAQILSGLKKIL
jgi:hypothetical protein